MQHQKKRQAAVTTGLSSQSPDLMAPEEEVAGDFVMTQENTTRWGKPFCPICHHAVKDWEKHIKTIEHIALSNPNRKLRQPFRLVARVRME